jgi:hypothetical protein
MAIPACGRAHTVDTSARTRLPTTTTPTGTRGPTMNKQEIDEMMSRLPSQQKHETTLQKVWIGVWFIMFVILCVYAPDITYQPKEIANGNCQENSVKESRAD